MADPPGGRSPPDGRDHSRAGEPGQGDHADDPARSAGAAGSRLRDLRRGRGERNETLAARRGSPFAPCRKGCRFADVAALHLSRSVVEGVAGWPLADELRSAFTKIDASLNPRMREFLSTLPQVVSTKAGPRTRGLSGKLVDITRRLFDAARAGVVEMRYFSAASRRAKHTSCTPSAGARAGGVAIGGCPRTKNSAFAAERIERLSVKSEPFRKTAQADPSATCSGLDGCVLRTGRSIELEFDARIAPCVRSRLWHDSQKVDELVMAGWPSGYTSRTTGRCAAGCWDSVRASASFAQKRWPTRSSMSSHELRRSTTMCQERRASRIS